MTDPSAAPTEIAADYFDGRSARAHAVRVRVEQEHLVIEGDDILRQVALPAVRWPERRAARRACAASPGRRGAALPRQPRLDTWSAEHAGRRDSLVVRVQQRWKWVAVSLALLVGLGWVGYRHGLPLAARVVVAILPASADESLGDAALASIDANGLMKPSKLPADRQQAVRTAFAQAVSRLPAGDTPTYRLEFRDSTIGPNAFALPGGAIVLTDQLYQRVDGDPAMLVGVLGPRTGHLRHRHGMRMLVQAGVLSAAAAAIYGDFSTLFSQIPVLLGQANYSREFEHEADVDSCG